MFASPSATPWPCASPPRLKLSFTVTNAFNVNGVNSRYTDSYGAGQISQQYIPPRQILGTVSCAFR